MSTTDSIQHVVALCNYQKCSILIRQISHCPLGSFAFVANWVLFKCLKKMLIGIWESGEEKKQQHTNGWLHTLECLAVGEIQTRVPLYVWISFAVAKSKYIQINAIEAVSFACANASLVLRTISNSFVDWFLFLHSHHTTLCVLACILDACVA